MIAINDRDYVKGIEWLRKAEAIDSTNPAVYTMLGSCLASIASTCEDETQSKDYYKQAIEAFDKAKELDPEKRLTDWGYHRYQAYYGLYGEDDPRTKAAGADK